MEPRTHAQIIEASGGVASVRQALLPAFPTLPDETVRSWPKAQKGAGSIPPEYWPSFVSLGFCSLDELAAAAEARKFPDLAAERVAARSDAVA